MKTKYNPRQEVYIIWAADILEARIEAIHIYGLESQIEYEIWIGEDEKVFVLEGDIALSPEALTQQLLEKFESQRREQVKEASPEMPYEPELSFNTSDNEGDGL